MSMDYNSRLRAITTQLNSFLRQFNQPQIDEVSRMRRLKATAEAINKRIAESSDPGSLADRVEDGFQKLMETTKARDWPRVEEFVKAMEATAPRSSGEITFALNPADKIRAGQPIGDSYIYGRAAVELIRDEGLTEDDFKPYRSGMFFAGRDAHGEDIARRIEGEMRLRHDRARVDAGLSAYFSNQMEAAQ